MMKVMRGKNIVEMDLAQFREIASRYHATIVDIGTGDGKYVYRLARSNPSFLYIGIDSSPENLMEYSVKVLKKSTRGGVPNVLYVIASTEDLPEELNGMASEIHINFPWGSLLKGIVLGDESILAGIVRISSRQARLEMLINYSLFSDPVPLEVLELPELTTAYIDNVLAPTYAKAGISIVDRETLGKDKVKDIPTTWAKKLAYGREPRTIHITAQINK